MGRAIKQFRYYGASDDRNYPNNITSGNLSSGSIFTGGGSGGGRILQLGIQTLPGVKFYVNEGLNPIIIGYTGIYDLELDGVTYISQLRFDVNSLKFINNAEDGYLIVDCIIEEGANI